MPIGHVFIVLPTSTSSLRTVCKLSHISTDHLHTNLQRTASSTISLKYSTRGRCLPSIHAHGQTLGQSSLPSFTTLPAYRHWRDRLFDLLRTSDYKSLSPSQSIKFLRSPINFLPLARLPSPSASLFYPRRQSSTSHHAGPHLLIAGRLVKKFTMSKRKQSSNVSNSPNVH